MPCLLNAIRRKVARGGSSQRLPCGCHAGHSRPPGSSRTHCLLPALREPFQLSRPNCTSHGKLSWNFATASQRCKVSFRSVGGILSDSAGTKSITKLQCYFRSTRRAGKRLSYFSISILKTSNRICLLT